jgi:hypothetical protein
MRKTLARWILAAAFACCSPYACADVWTEYGRVTAVMYLDDGTLHVWADMPRADPGGCGGDRYIFPATNANIKEAYASILMAFGAGKRARFYLWSSPCTLGNPSARLVEIRD